MVDVEGWVWRGSSERPVGDLSCAGSEAMMMAMMLSNDNS